MMARTARTAHPGRMNGVRVIEADRLDAFIDDIQTEGEAIDGIREFGDVHFSDFGISLSEIGDQLKSAAAGVAQNVAASNSRQLRNIGKKVAANAIWSATEPLPMWIRKYVQPEFVPPDPTPQWVTNIVNPLTAPIAAGAQEEALRAAAKLKAPLYGTVTLILLTIFGGGYILGRVVSRRN